MKNNSWFLLESQFFWELIFSCFTANSEYSDLQQRMSVLKTAADLPAFYLFALKTAYVREQILWIELAWYGVSNYLM